MSRFGRAVGALVLLDADVLYPIRICDFILTASSVRLLARPIVSDTILNEAQRNVLADRPNLGLARIERRFASVRAVVDGHGHSIEVTEDVTDVNPKDRHVLSAAIHHGVGLVVTNDARLRSEIGEWLGQQQETPALVAAVSADELAAALVDDAPDRVESVIRLMADRFRNPSRDFDETLDGLVRSMPALGRLRR